MKNFLPALLLLAIGCQSRAIVGDRGDGGAPGDWVALSPPRHKIDLLFMIDNSPSMAPKQAELKSRFPQLLQILEDAGKTTPLSLHIGVVTSDLGAGLYDINRGQCHPGGDGGRLQAKGAAADPTCGTLGNGLHFIDYDQHILDVSGQPVSNLPAGEDLATAFGCMASVGDLGCGFESPLESVYKALHDDVPDNAGFLRDDALLVVVWLTDEDDDCSIDPASDLFNPDPSAVATYGPLLSYRGTQYGVTCDGQTPPLGDSGGPLSNCVPAPNPTGNLVGPPPPGQGKCYDVSRYIEFFTRPKANGGVKVDPRDLILAGITAPETPFQVLLANVKSPSSPYQSCSGPIDPSGSGCTVVLQHSCISPTNTSFFGDPAVRIRAVINAMASVDPFNSQNTSICDTSYQQAMQGLGEIIASRTGVAMCVDAAIATASSPECEVEVEVVSADGTVSVETIPSCGPNADAGPCWQIVGNPQCAEDVSTPGFSLEVQRPVADPPDPILSARCRS